MEGHGERQRLMPPTIVTNTRYSSSDLGLAPEPGRGAGCRRRYLALVLFSWFAFSQGLARSISFTTEDTFPFMNTTTNRLLLSSWSAVGFLAFPVFMYLMDKNGLRTSLMAALFALLLGSGLRCIPSAPPGAQTWLIHSSQLLIAMAGPSAIAAAPFISSTWFPQDERSIATAIGALANYLGAASAFLIQSILAHSVDGLATPGGLRLLSHGPIEAHVLLKRMQIMLYVEFGMIAILFVLVVLLMPRHPLLYPSTSAATRRLHYTEAIPRLLRRPGFWLAVAVYAFPLGVGSAWLKQLDSLLKSHLTTIVGCAELAAVLAGYLGALAVARLSDNFTGRLKVIILILLSGATLSAIWFTLSCLDMVSFLTFSTALPHQRQCHHWSINRCLPSTTGQAPTLSQCRTKAKNQRAESKLSPAALL
uniref:solute carrier family 49 member 4 isoform X2 n=1 Tax=Myxine glutinosa TaxID=7769 RepID=UPI00358ED308